MSDKHRRAATLRGALYTKRADEFAQSLAPLIGEALSLGRVTNTEIAQYLTARGIRTRTGYTIWSHQQVEGIRARLARLETD